MWVGFLRIFLQNAARLAADLFRRNAQFVQYINGHALIVARVTGVAFARSHRPASGSVPTLTDQRSTPQVGRAIVMVMKADAFRACASAILIGSDLAPAAVLDEVVAKNEKTLLPMVTSPCVPSS